MSRFSLVALQLLAILAGPAIVAAASPPVPGRPVLVFAPMGGGDFRNMIAAAGGNQIGPENAPLAGLAASADPAFPSRLLAAGAWLVIDGATLASICGAET